MFKFVWLVLVVLAVVSFPFLSGLFSSSGVGFGAKKIEQSIDEYVKAHPERILKALQEHHENEMRLNSARHFKQMVTENQEDLYDKSFPHVGSDMNAVKVVEFSNYMCPHCKRMEGPVSKFIENHVKSDDPKAVYFFRTLSFPNASDGGMAVKASLAVHKLSPEKFLDFHNMLLRETEYGNDFESFVIKKIKELGIDEEKFKSCVSSEMISKAKDSNSTLAGRLGIAGTPAFVIGDQVLMGAQSYDSLVAAMNEAITEKNKKRMEALNK